MTQTLRLVKEVPLTNGTLEGGTSSWASYGTPATFEQSATQKHSGTYSLKLVGQTAVGRGGSLTLPTPKVSTTYIISVWSYITSGSFSLQANGDSSGQMAITDLGAADSTWRQTFLTYTTNASDAVVIAYILSTTATPTGYFDDVRVYELLCDFQDVTDYGLREFGVVGMDSEWGAANLTLDVLGTSITDFGTNLERLTRAMKIGKQNRDASARGSFYAPLWLQWQPSTSTYMLQTECFGLSDDSDGAIAKVLAVPQTILSNRLENIGLNLKVRGYWEETSPVAVTSSPFTIDNSTGSASIASLRGDLPAPLRVKVRAATTNQTQIIAALKTQGTVGNFIEHFDLNSAAGTGYAVSHNATFTADRTDADLVNGKGARVTPTSAMDTATEIKVLTTVFITTNPNDHTGRYRILVRMRDNHASAVKAYLRVRSILADSSNAILGRGDYLDIARAGGAIGGTTILNLVDCGVGNFPYADFGGSGAYRIGIEISGYTLDASLATFDLDEVFMLPCHEGEDSGYISVSLPNALGNGAVPDGVISAFDRESDAYMVDASDAIQVNADSIAGMPLFAYPNQTQTLYVITRRLSTGVHTKGVNSTVQVDYVPRYRLVRGA